MRQDQESNGKQIDNICEQISTKNKLKSNIKQNQKSTQSKYKIDFQETIKAAEKFYQDVSDREFMQNEEFYEIEKAVRFNRYNIYKQNNQLNQQNEQNKKVDNKLCVLNYRKLRNPSCDSEKAEKYNHCTTNSDASTKDNTVDSFNFTFSSNQKSNSSQDVKQFKQSQFVDCNDEIIDDHDHFIPNNFRKSKQTNKMNTRSRSHESLGQQNSNENKIQTNEKLINLPDIKIKSKNNKTKIKLLPTAPKQPKLKQKNDINEMIEFGCKIQESNEPNQVTINQMLLDEQLKLKY